MQDNAPNKVDKYVAASNENANRDPNVAAATTPPSKPEVQFSPNTPVGVVNVKKNPYLPEGHPRRCSYDPNDPKNAPMATNPSNPTATAPEWVLGAGNRQVRVGYNDEDMKPQAKQDESVEPDDDSSGDTPIIERYRANKRSGKPTQTSCYARGYGTAAKHLLSEPSPSSFFRDGRKFNIHNRNANGSDSYRCFQYRNGCRARFTRFPNGHIVDHNTEHNDPECAAKNALAIGPSANQAIPDVTVEMQQYVDCQASMYSTKAAGLIAKECLAEMKLRHGARFTGLSKQQLCSRVYNTRNKIDGGVEKKRIMKEHMTCGHESFNRGQIASIDPKTGEMQEIMMFSKKSLLDRMKAKRTQVFFDATFSSVPKGFYQCLIVMIFDEVHDIYLPCYYALMSSKSESCYRMTFKAMVEDLGGKFDPATIGVDFEQAFINALREVFPKARIIGCLFHWKQAIRRKLLELGFPKEVVASFMKPGKLDLLTVLPLEDVMSVDSKGVLYVAREIESAEGAWPIKLEDGTKQSVQDWVKSPEGSEKMVKFWCYMERQWFGKKGMIQLWNLSEYISSDDGFHLVSRTNCALESYNRIFNNKFARRHPGLSTFVAGLNEETDDQVTRLENVAAGRDIPPTYDDIPFPEIPSDYADFEAPSLAYFRLTSKGSKKDEPKQEEEEEVRVVKKSARSDSAPTGVSPVKKSARTLAVSDPAPAAAAVLFPDSAPTSVSSVAASEPADPAPAAAVRKSKRVAAKKK